VFGNAVAGLGLAPEAAMVTFPIEMFLPESDISPVEARRQEFYDGLMHWEPATAAGSGGSRMLAIEGASYEAALTQFNHMGIAKRWSDGLPLLLPTRERVDWVLQGAASARDRLLGKMPPRGGLVTVETCAIALAMAGGRPEYLPVLVAAMEAFLDPATSSDQLQAASGGAFPVVIVNGPVGTKIRLNSGFGCLGPDPQHPAGASIGRALRLLQQNAGGALPGIGAMAMYGGMRYTNAVFAEDEASLPAGWQPHGTTRHGYRPGTNSISLVFASGATNIRRRGAKKETAEEDARYGMWRIADYMRAPNLHYLPGWTDGTSGVLMIPGVVARQMAELGWTQDSIRQFLWDNSKIPREHIYRCGANAWIEVDGNAKVRDSIALDPWPVSQTPDTLTFVVAGGGHPTNVYWLQGYSFAVVGREIALPDGFDALIGAAAQDLGPA
jgi:hypothetical protein